MEFRIDVAPNEVVSRIREWYKPEDWQMMTMCATDTGTNIEVQWMFSAYRIKNEFYAFRSYFGYEDTIPSVNDFIWSAWIIEREIVDLFGVKVEGAAPGLMLDVDSRQAPLRKKK